MGSNLSNWMNSTDAESPIGSPRGPSSSLSLLFPLSSLFLFLANFCRLFWVPVLVTLHSFHRRFRALLEGSDWSRSFISRYFKGEIGETWVWALLRASEIRGKMRSASSRRAKSALQISSEKAERHQGYHGGGWKEGLWLEKGLRITEALKYQWEPKLSNILGLSVLPRDEIDSMIWNNPSGLSLI